jgi:ATP-dependent DNA ligase
MLARRIEGLPPGEGWIFEPKWDGFRALFFRDGDELLIQSRDGKPLDRYFPELVEPLKAGLPARCVLDGEIVIARDGGLDFDALQQRMHPAASRVALLARETPASVVFFDILCEDSDDLRDMPFGMRRMVLESLLAEAQPPLHLTPATADRGLAADWFRRFEGAGLDGVVAKADAGPYEPNRRVMLKVKHERDCDCVVAGFRWHKSGEGTAVGSLLLGLYDSEGALQHVGVCASFTDVKRRELVAFLAPYAATSLADHPWGDSIAGQTAAELDAHRRPGTQSRWSGGKDLAWQPLRPELVVEVAYDGMQNNRFRHTAQFRRWRIDKPAADCTFEQLETVPPQELAELFPEAR